VTLGAAQRPDGRTVLRLPRGGLGLLGQDLVLGAGFTLLITWAQLWARSAGWVPDAPQALLLVGFATGAAIAGRRRWPLATLLLTTLVYPALYLISDSLALTGDASSSRPVTGVPMLPALISLYQCASIGRPRLRWIMLLGTAATGLLSLPLYRLLQLVTGGASAADFIPDPGRPVTAFTLAVAILPLTVMVTSLALASAAIALGHTVLRQRRMVAELSRRNAELHRLRTAESERTVAAERSRIARELHDVVAHHISAVVIRAQAADRVAASRPEEAGAAVRWIATTGQEALAAMRQVVRVLRSPSTSTSELAPGPTLAALPEVAERLTGVGLRVELHLPDPLPVLPAPVDLAAVRIAQEALTNVLVHARADRAVVQVVIEDGKLVVDVQDDGVAGTDPIGRDGHGLIGMRERAAACGGRLSIGRSPLGGWEVTARIPLSGAAG
jgi:signal transduction histidine kinase